MELYSVESLILSFETSVLGWILYNLAENIRVSKRL